MNIIYSGAGRFLPLTGGTMTGNIVMGANHIKTTALTLKEGATSRFNVRNLADDAWAYTEMGGCFFHNNVAFSEDARGLGASDVDSHYFILRARDTGYGMVEVARVLGAADPEFQAGHSGNAIRATNAGLLGFYGVAPVARPAAIATWAPAGGDQDGLARGQINQILTLLKSLGLMA